MYKYAKTSDFRMIRLKISGKHVSKILKIASYTRARFLHGHASLQPRKYYPNKQLSIH